MFNSTEIASHAMNATPKPKFLLHLLEERIPPAQGANIAGRMTQDLILVGEGLPQLISNKFPTDQPFIIGAN